MASCKFKDARLLGPSSSSSKKKKNKKRKKKKNQIHLLFCNFASSLSGILLLQHPTHHHFHRIRRISTRKSIIARNTQRVPSESALSLVGRRDDVDEERDGRRHDFHP
jgi:hypothetical protein